MRNSEILAKRRDFTLRLLSMIFVTVTMAVFASLVFTSRASAFGGRVPPPPPTVTCQNGLGVVVHPSGYVCKSVTCPDRLTWELPHTCTATATTPCVDNVAPSPATYLPAAPSNVFPETSDAGAPCTYMINELCSRAENCMPGKITAAVIYVPSDILGTAQAITIVDGCDNNPSSSMDRSSGTKSFFSITNSPASTTDTENIICLSGLHDLSMIFTPTLANSSGRQGDYYKYYFTANMVGPGNTDVGTYAYNMYRLQALSPRLRIGVSDVSFVCPDAISYKNSCPSVSPLYTSASVGYSSFSQAPINAEANGGSFNQHIVLPPCHVDMLGQIDIYDLDANIYGQNNIRARIIDVGTDGVTTYIPDSAGANLSDDNLWAPANGNDGHLILPDSANLLAMYSFKQGHTYTLEINNLTRTNTLQIFVNYVLPGGGTPSSDCNKMPSCTAAMSVTDAVTGSPDLLTDHPLRFTVPVTNANGYQIGVNGPSWGPEIKGPDPGSPTTDIINYLANDSPASPAQSKYARASSRIVGDGPQTLSLTQISYQDEPSYGAPLINLVDIRSPLVAGSYEFNWGFVDAGHGWGNNICKATINVRDPVPIIKCDMANLPTEIEPGQIVDIIPKFTNTGLGALNGAQLNVFTNDGFSFSTYHYYANIAYTPSPLPSLGSAIGATITATSNTSMDSFYVSYSFSGGNAPVFGVPDKVQCSKSIPKVSRPYIKVFGGDVRAGAAFAPACATTGTGGIYGWGNLLDGSGSSTQYGAMARGPIPVSQFSTADLRAPLQRQSLFFAKIDFTVTSGNFGPVGCQPNYWAALRGKSINTGADRLVSLSTPGYWEYPHYGTLGCGTDNAYKKSGDTCHVVGGPLPTVVTSKQTIFVDGNLSIMGNIVYSGAWSSVDDIPNLTIVVCGNIYIDKSVTEITGWYVAIPRKVCLPTAEAESDPGGVIRTCMNRFAEIIASQLKTDCSTKLTVRGSFSAERIKFQRTQGSYGARVLNESSLSANTAEVFVTDPSNWISSPLQGSGGSGSGTLKLDGISGLPSIF